MHFSTLLAISTCSSPEVVLAFLLYDGGTIHNASDQFVSCVYFFFVTPLFIHPHRQKSDLYAPTSKSCVVTPIENWTRVYMNLFTRNSPYCHLLKYLLFLLKHSVYNTHLFLVPRLRMSGVIPLFPYTPSWRGQRLYLYMKLQSCTHAYCWCTNSMFTEPASFSTTYSEVRHCTRYWFQFHPPPIPNSLSPKIQCKFILTFVRSVK